jgi:hypothetical protein
MHPIFFAWKGTYDDLLATCFYAHGERTRTIPIGTTGFIGVIEASTPKVRGALNGLSPNFTMLPGPNATINAAHATALNAILPTAQQVKEGDALAPTLKYVHGLFGDHEFNPDNF